MAPITEEPAEARAAVDAFEDLRAVLLEKRAHLVELLGFDPLPAADRPTGSPGETEHLSVSEQRDVDEAIGSLQRKALHEVDEALARLAAGTYGLCTGCGAEIPIERLEVIPETGVCVRCG